ncbi:sterol desaturase family protein [Flagellimonas pacifica]|uniref:Sterol desaturase/sphingolipid hydroxylase, fatty acid hydroxylase superfamily n=1 Tax=Flagellimonas pacifica TaxID=1247520 RepID=A0A285MTS1_9FLAO|nr:sterol desaturase family protein [Allomuricauda parva]SNZ00600.1 Sterol desaturase/sphingolipid hydroxylase, fatty acid hydroxylase superfamily [Allomuricauda parva]
MNSKKVLSLTAVPALLTISMVFGYVAILEDWNLLLCSFIILFFSFSSIYFLERIIPLNESWRIHKGTILTEVLHFSISIGLFDAIGKTVALWFVLLIQSNFFEVNPTWSWLPFWLIFIIANIVGEFLPYLYHRISHKGNANSVFSLFLWQVHSIHHISEQLNWFKTNWMHPLNMLLNTFLKIAPLLLLGFSESIIFLVGIFHIMVAYLSHSNILVKTGFLDYIIVTPKIHHFHHSKKMDEAKNYGNIIPFWDLVFGTFYNRNGYVEKVGVNKAFYKYPEKTNYIKQVVFPFKGYKYCCNKTISKN